MINLKLTPRLAGVLLAFILNAGMMLFFFNFGFNLWVYLPVAIITFVIALFSPATGLMSALILTLVFASKYTIQPIIINSDEYKLFLIDIPILGVYLNLFINLLNHKIKWRFSKIDKILALVVGLVIIYAALSLWRWQGNFALIISSLKNYAFYPLIFWASYLTFNTQEKRNELLGVGFIGCLMILGFLFYGLLSGQGIWTDITPLSTEGSRFLDFDHAFYLALAAIIGFTALVYNKIKAHQAILVCLVFIFAFGVAASLMRHLLIAGIISAVAFLLLIKPDKLQIAKRYIFSYVLLGACLLSTLMLLINLWPQTIFSQQIQINQSNFITRVQSIGNSQDTSIAWRNEVWQALWQDYRHNFLFGIGFGQRVFVDMSDYLDYVEVRNVHNSFLAMLVQLGLVPFSVFVWFLIRQLKSLIKSRSKPVAVAVASILIFCLVAFNFQPYLEANFFSYIFWLILGYSKYLYEGAVS